MNSSPVTIIGNLTSDPELSFTGSGVARANFSVACNRRYKKGEEWVEETSFFRVLAWRYLAEDIARVLEKGNKVIVVGRLEQQSWQDSEGNNRSSVQIVADDVAASVGRLESIERRVSSGVASGSSVPDLDPGEAPW